MGYAGNGESSLRYTRSLRRGYASSFFKKNSEANIKKAHSLKYRKARNKKQYSNFRLKNKNYTQIDRIRNRKVLIEMFFVFIITSILVSISFSYFNKIKFKRSPVVVHEPLSFSSKKIIAGYHDSLSIAYNFYNAGDYETAIVKFETLGRLWRPSFNALFGLTKCYMYRCVNDREDCTLALEYYNVLNSSGLLSQSQEDYLNSIWDNN